MGQFSRRTILTCSLLLLPASALGQVTDGLRFPDIVDVKVNARGADVFDFDVTVSSPYETRTRYADAFRAKTVDGAILGERILLHDHVDEQPFTRDLYGVKIPAGVKLVIIEGRDQKSGWGGKTFAVTLPGR